MPHLQLRLSTGRSHRRLFIGLIAAVAALVGGVVAGPRMIGDAGAASRPAGSPYGVAEHIWFHPGGLTFIGWAVDPNAANKPMTVYFTVDNKLAGKVVANLPRPDVAKAHRPAGPNHGYRTFVKIPEGKHRVCVRGLNVGAGSNVSFRCDDRVMDYGPVGALQSVKAAAGKVTVSGWTFDYDNPKAPLTVKLTVDRTSSSLVADDPNSAATKVNASAGTKHGFTFKQAVSQGSHKVCVRITNLGYGTDSSFACRTVTLNDNPRGYLDSAAQSGGKLRVRGWSFDPDAPTSAATVLIKIDNTTHAAVANKSRTDVGRVFPGTGTTHGYDASYVVGEGNHTVCVTLKNVANGRDAALRCRTARVNFTPTAAATSIAANRTGATLSGWATDPDTTAAVSVLISLDGRTVSTVTANRSGSSHSGHNFTVNVNTKSGAHTVCAVARNAGSGTHNSAASCKKITLTLKPLGHYDTLTRATGSDDVKVVGWAFDPDSASALTVDATVDGKAAGSLRATTARPDVQKAFPSGGPNRGFSSVLATDDGEHTVCLTARNVGAGANVLLGCKLIIAVHPVAPSAPRSVTATAGFGGATVTWTPPASDGGAPWSKYVVTASSGASVTVGATTTSATITGLKPNTSYSFSVTAVNVAGSSTAAVSPTVKTQAGPPPQTTPAPVSTSRYIRNIRGASSTDLTTMRNEGLADARANPSGHGYVILLDIGGQDDFDGGVVLSATTRFISYANLVKNIQSYVDGYHAGQKASAPVTIAIGTNNDMEVTTAAGRSWADKVVDPIVAYAKKYTGMSIAGANDIEPGFRATYTQTKSWLGGYLAATSAPFIFNGSADGCSWTTVNRGCNNGWSMSGLYYLAAGAAPVRMLNLPQIYNYTMADQWKYISLTGVAQRKPRINFAGVLTEWTACDQAGSCGSITGRTAWAKMWSNLQSDTRLKVGSLPYATDLRIDR